MHEKEGIKAIFEPDASFTRSELAKLFGLYMQTITANIKAIIGSGVVKPRYDGALEQIGRTTVLPVYFDIEMVIALAFRINSPVADQIRKFVLKKVAAKSRSVTHSIFIRYSMDSEVN